MKYSSQKPELVPGDHRVTPFTQFDVAQLRRKISQVGGLNLSYTNNKKSINESVSTSVKHYIDWLQLPFPSTRVQNATSWQRHIKVEEPMEDLPLHLMLTDNAFSALVGGEKYAQEQEFSEYMLSMCFVHQGFDDLTAAYFSQQSLSFLRAMVSFCYCNQHIPETMLRDLGDDVIELITDQKGFVLPISLVERSVLQVKQLNDRLIGEMLSCLDFETKQNCSAG
tara:strand:+ start:88 stop:759 length:672 start_codon:yes stop_codon:yes gene_type:complete